MIQPTAGFIVYGVITGASISELFLAGIIPGILVGLFLGIAVGLFLGDLAGPLQLAAQAYVRLLQMTVLPYIVFSLIGNIGSLSLRDFGLLARAGLLIFVGLWALAALTVLGMSQALPLGRTQKVPVTRAAAAGGGPQRPPESGAAKPWA